MTALCETADLLHVQVDRRNRPRRSKPACESADYQVRGRCPMRGSPAEKDKINVVFYESGKLVVQGKGTQEFVEFVLEPEF